MEQNLNNARRGHDGRLRNPSTRTLIALTTATLLVAVLSGCSNASVEQAQPNGSSTSDIGAVAESDPPESAEPALVLELMDTTFDEFNDVDGSKIRAYALYSLLSPEWVENHEKLPADANRPTWTTPSIDMSGQAILDNWQYVLDDARATQEFNAQDEAHYINHDTALKKLGAAYYEIHDGLVTASYKSARDDILAHDKGYYVSNESKTRVSESPITSGKDYAGKEAQFKDIVFVDQDGIQRTATMIWSEFNDVNGNPSGSWYVFNVSD